MSRITRVVFFKYVLITLLVACVVYFNFRPNNNTSQFIPVELLGSLGFNSAQLVYLKGISDKLAHFGVGLILASCFFLLFGFRAFSKTEQGKILPHRVIFRLLLPALSLLVMLELSQWLYRASHCGDTYICNAVYFSWVDIVAGVVGVVIGVVGLVFFSPKVYCLNNET